MSPNCGISLQGTTTDPAAENEYVGGLCFERKIDLTNYIKWWGSNKTRQTESILKSSEESKHEDIGSELKLTESAVQSTEPYQMPRLGMPIHVKKRKGSKISALSVLSQSAAFKSLQEKALKRQENDDENENKNTNTNYGKAVEKAPSQDVLGMSGGLSVQRNVYQLTPLLTGPLLTNYSSIDPLVDPILWTSLLPVIPTGLSRNSEVNLLSISYIFV